MIEIKDLHVSYGQSEVIHGVNLEAKAGQIVAVMGRNGMGKTTLFKSLMGVIRSTSGTIKINGVDVTKMPSYQRVKQGIAYVPQGRMIFPSLTVWENLLTGLEGSPTGKLPRGHFHALSGAGRDEDAPRRQPLRRPTAAAGDRARAGGRAQGAACSTSRRKAFSPR